MARRKGFTLVELLVVIGIIALLIGILMPALNAARRQSRTIKCLSNLRTIGQGFHMYAQNNKGMWPVAYHEVTYSVSPLVFISSRWYDRLSPYIFGQEMMNMGGTSLTGANGATGVPAHQNSVIWGCPEWSRLEQFESTSDWARPGYAMQYMPLSPTVAPNVKQNWAYVDNANPGLTGKYMSQTIWQRKGTDRLLMVDGMQPFLSIATAVRTPGSFSSNNSWNPFPATTAAEFWVDGARHAKPGLSKLATYKGRFTNTLFCDGHAATISVREAWQAVIEPGGNSAGH